MGLIQNIPIAMIAVIVVVPVIIVIIFTECVSDSDPNHSLFFFQ
jgi:hypothetical protein